VRDQETTLPPQQKSNSPNEVSWSSAARARIAGDPVSAILLFTIAASVIVFYFVLGLYRGAPIMVWAWKHWLPNLNQEHGKLVIPIALALVWYHRKKLLAAPKKGSNWGLPILGVGFLILLVGVRALQPRITLFALPVLLFGIVIFVWGFGVARILMFPIAFLVFMIPVGAIEQTSFRLQFMITNTVQVLSNLVGIKIYAVGTTLRPLTGDWEGFTIEEGCSGIRSLVAIIMLTAIYAHIFEKELWKKAVVLAFSIGFAVIANAGRIFTIILIANAGYPKFAGGIYHEYSGFISFPIALIAMYFFHKLLNFRSRKAELAPAAKMIEQ
jgi:exosortase